MCLEYVQARLQTTVWTRTPLPVRAALRRALPLLCAAALVGVAPVPAAAAAVATAPAPPALVVLGDSLSAAYGIRPEQGWVALLQQRLSTEGYGYQVINASVSGETSGGGLARLPHVLATHRPQILLVELGSNDGLRGLPVDELQHNLAAIVTAAQKAGAHVVLVGMRIPPNYGPEYTSRFAAAFAAVASAFHTALVPFLLEHVALDDANFQADRLHPVAAAEPRVLEAVWPVLKPMLGRAATVPAAAR